MRRLHAWRLAALTIVWMITVERAGDEIDWDRARWNGDATGRKWRSGLVGVEDYLLDRQSFLLSVLPPAPVIDGSDGTV